MNPLSFGNQKQPVHMSFLKYSASAGSGKTFTLVKEYLKIALGSDDPMVFSRILAITFTNKAANEMTDRILETLEEISGVVTPMQGRSADLMKILADELAVSEDVIKNRSRKTLKKIVHNYRDFSVGTIDSFVHKVIRSFAQELGLNQTFEVELNTDRVLKRAVDFMLDRVGVDDVLTRFIEDYIDSKFEKGNTWKIDEDLYMFAKNLMRSHDWYYLEKAKSVDIRKYAEVYGVLKKSVYAYENALMNIAENAVEYALNNVEKSSYAGGGTIVNYFIKITRRDFQPELLKSLQKLMVEGANWVSKKGASDRLEIEERMPKLLDWLSEIEQIRYEKEAQYIFDKLLFDNIYQVALLSEIDREVRKIKAENDLVLISDFNALVSDITRNEPVPFIYEKLGEKYEHYLLDEFQDTSLMQWHNMLPLVENCLSKGGTTMVVGDAKQSIYRWRGGVVEQFGMLPEIYNPYNDYFAAERGLSIKNNLGETSPLETNYRSKANIVAFNNEFFTHVANTLDSATGSYYDDVEQKIKDELSQGYVEFRFFYENQELSIEAVFAQIVELIHNVRSDGFDLKDIAILTKTKKQTPLLVEHLNLHQIDVISSESLLVKNSHYVKLIVAALHHLNQPSEGFYMKEILMRFNEISPQKYFHTTMANIDKITVDEFNSILLTWGVSFDRAAILTQPLYEMVTGLLNVFDANDIKDNRLAAWLGFVFQQSLKTGYGLYDLLDDWKLQEDKLSIQIPEDVDAVRVMTIHAAKGLDWPIVILAQGNWKVSHASHTFWVELPDANPIPAALLPHTSKVKQTIFLEQYEEEEDAVMLDSINAMYVAFTRPSQRLYVFSIKPKESFFKPLLPILANMNNPKVEAKYAEISYMNRGKITTANELISWSYGVTEFHDGEKKEVDSNLIQLSNRRNSAYQKKLKVKKNYMKRMNNLGQIDFGNLVHKAFSFIETPKDVEKAVNDLWKSGEVNDSEKLELTKHILRVISHQDVAQYFTGSVEIKNEAEIILANGDLLRPDRVLIDYNRATVIDFKTGMKKPEHEQQVLAYKQQLQNMGYTSVKAVLIYTGDVEVVEV